MQTDHVQCFIILYIFYNTQHNTTQHNTTQHNTTQHNTTQHNTTQHTAIYFQLIPQRQNHALYTIVQDLLEVDTYVQ